MARTGRAGMMESSFTFLKVRGIRIGAHWSWLLVFAYISWALGTAIFPQAHPGLAGSTYLAMGLVSALAFFASIVLHELGHAFRALREGMRIDGITLWLFGGVARFSGMFPSAGAEFRIAVAGPIVSVAIAAVFALLALASQQLEWPGTVRGVTEYLARINAILVGFNMVPALPLDGGRVLRAWLWHRQGSFTAATVSASRAGRAFAYVLIGIGILAFFSRARGSGIWFVFLGWFLLQAAQAEASFAMVLSAFRHLRVRDLMSPDPVIVSPDMTVAHFLSEVTQLRGHSSYPVADGGRLAGLVSLRLAAGVPLQAREQTTVAQVMLPRNDVPTVPPDSEVLDALEAIRTGPGPAVVVSDERIEGIVSASDVARALEVERARGMGAEPGRRGAGWIPWTVVVVVMTTAVGLLYHPPVAVISPRPPIDVSRDVRISGVPVDRLNGRYLLTAVGLDQPSALGAVVALVRPDREVVLISDVVPPGSNQEEFVRQQKAIFRQSQMLAAAAAARAVGMEATLSGTGARVVRVAPRSPADRVLRQGDVIVAIDDREVKLLTDVREIIGSRPQGTSFRLTLERDGRRLETDIRSRRIEAGGEAIVGIGVVIETRGFEVDLPFEVKFLRREIGGPSAGLAYALAIADMLDPADVARGRTIAATGTINAVGAVGPIGGIREKAVAARGDRAQLFLVPRQEAGEAQIGGLAVRGVRTLEEALGLLRQAS